MSRLAVPRFASIAKRGDVARAAAHVGFPAIVKAVDGCGSLLVRRVDSLAQLHAIIRSVANRSVPDMGREVGQAMMLESISTAPSTA
ncbi:hypothetical protein AB3X91_35695 [Paraburkholderia sp. BR14263]|uniref:hypothetical protein n=1 Tax=unclassified Paraburkholderia TaxID=2615204 RepID=UPI0034CD7314